MPDAHFFPVDDLPIHSLDRISIANIQPAVIAKGDPSNKTL
jgi:hypothetical protein